MTFSEYEVEEKDTLGQYVRQLSQDEQYRELILGLYEETAEVTSPIRRSIKGNYHEQEIDFEHLKEELGDVLWYIAQIASQLPNVDFQQVAIANLIKTHTIHQKELTSTETDLDFTEYVQGVSSTFRRDLPNALEERARYFSMGLIKEVGKLSELFGEHMIDKTILDIYKAKEKLGDGLWYLAAISQTYGLDFEDIARLSIEKTHSRYNSQGIAQRDERD